MILAPFLCLIASVHDGDSITCADRTKIRIAGIQSPDFTNTDPCRKHRTGYTCDDAAAIRARDIVAEMIQGRELRCHPVDTSYNRVVATCSLPDGRDLSCAVIAAGA